MLGEDTATVEHQVAEQPVLRGREGYLLPATPDPMGILIEGQRADGKPSGGELDSPRAPQDRLDSQRELLETEGLGQVVVTTTQEAGSLVGRVVPRREEDDWYRVATCSDLAAEVEPVEVGQHDV